ncbi:MAG: hypothetical protein ACPGVC_02310 [Salibacteraceae bacterium]
MDRGRQHSKYKFLLFLIWPISVLFINPKSTPLWLYVLLYGFLGSCMILSGDSMDGHSYVQMLEYWSGKSFSDLFKLIFQVSTFSSAKSTDFFVEVIYYFLSRFTIQPTYLFLVFGLLFGTFYLRSINTLEQHCPNEQFDWRKILVIVLMILIINPLFAVNQFRFWMGTAVYLFAIMKYLTTKNNKFFLLLIGSAFIHFGMVLPIVIAFLYRIIGDRLKFLWLLLAISIFVAELNILSFLSGISVTGSIGYKMDGYTSEQAFERSAQLKTMAWYAVYWKDITLYSGLGFLFLYYKKNANRITGFHLTLLSFTLLFCSIVFFLENFPMIFRYKVIGVYLVLASILLVPIKSLKKQNLYFISLLMVPSFIIIGINFFFVLRNLSILSIISPAIVPLFTEVEITLANVLGIK